MITEEWAKNPKAEIQIQCQFCKSRHKIEDFLKHEALSVDGYPDLIDVFWFCSTCQGRKHAYYLTNSLLQKQVELKEMLAVYNKSHSSADFDRHRRAVRVYQTAFDNLQLNVKTKLGVAA